MVTSAGLWASWVVASMIAALLTERAILNLYKSDYVQDLTGKKLLPAILEVCLLGTGVQDVGRNRPTTVKGATNENEWPQ